MARRSAYTLSAMGLLLLVILYWFFLLSPVRDEISQTEQQIATERQQLQAAQAKLAQMEQTRLEAKRNNARLIQLAKMVPVEDGVPSLILQVQDLAAESGIEFMSISPAAEKGQDAMAPIPLTLTFQGTFFDVNDFLYRTERMAAAPGRLLAAKNVSLSGGEGAAVGASPTLQVALQLDAYRRARPANLEPVAPEPPAPVEASRQGEPPSDTLPENAVPEQEPAGDQASVTQPN